MDFTVYTGVVLQFFTCALISYDFFLVLTKFLQESPSLTKIKDPEQYSSGDKRLAIHVIIKWRSLNRKVPDVCMLLAHFHLNLNL